MPTPPSNEHHQPPAGSPGRPAVGEDVIARVIQGDLSPAEAAEILGVPTGSILRQSRERSTADGHPPESKAIAGDQTNRFSRNWQKALEGAKPIPKKRSQIDLAIQSFAPARWLFGTEGRRLAVAALIGTGLFAAVLVVSLRSLRQAIPPDAPTSPTTAPSTVESVSLPTEKDYQRAEKVARAFIAAETWQQKLAFVRNRTTVEPLMRKWYEGRGGELVVTGDVEFVEAKGTTIGDSPFVVLETAPGAVAPLVLAVDLSGAEPKIDWESHVHYQPTTWEQFKAERPSSAVLFRVRAETSDYYVEPFEDSERYISVRLTSPTAVVGLNGFAERHSELGIRLAHLLEFSDRPQTNLSLSLRFPSDYQSPAVEILTAAAGWVR